MGAEDIWRSKTDEQLLAACAVLDDYTEEGQRIIRAELERRGLEEPPPVTEEPPDDGDPGPGTEDLPTMDMLLAPTSTSRPRETPAAVAPKSRTANPETVVGHWNMLIENLSASPLAFYKDVENALSRRQIPFGGSTRVDYKESGLLSARREYLQIRRERLIFDLCGAPFGTGFFVSWWLAEAKAGVSPVTATLGILTLFGAAVWSLDALGFVWGSVALVLGVLGGMSVIRALDAEFLDDFARSVPVLGGLYVRLFRPPTYYRIDTMEMFQKAVHNAVQDVIDEMTTAKGLRALSEAERKPVMREFYRS